VPQEKEIEEIEEADALSYVPSAQEEKDIAYARSFKDEAYRQTQKERAEWRRAYDRYKLARNLSEYDYIDDVHLGLTYDATERKAAELPGREFGFIAKPVGEDDVRDALLVSEVLRQTWESPMMMNGPTRMENIRKQMALFGNCFCQVLWETKIDENGNIIKSDPGFYPLNIFNVFYNKFFSEVQDLPEIGYQFTVPLQWVKDSAKTMGFKNTKYVRGITTEVSSQDEDSTTTERSDTPSGEIASKHHRMAKIFELQSDKWIYTFAIDGGNWIRLRRVKNKIGMKNVVLFRYKRHPLPDRLLGVTDVARGGEIEDAIQRAMNQAVFNSLMVDNPGFTYDKTDRNIDPRTFIMAPGAGLPRGRDANSITPLNFKSHIGESLTMIRALFERWKRVVNSLDISSGIGDASANTATESNILDTNAKVPIDKIVDGMKGTMLDIWQILKKMYEVYGPDSLTIQVYAPELLEKLGSTNPESSQEFTVEKDSLIKDRDVEVSVGFTTQNKSILSRRIVEWLGITSKDAAVPQQLKMLGYQQWLEFNDLTDLALKFDELIRQNQTSDLSVADLENQKMAQGMQLPPTPNASVAHTQRHVEFLRRAETGPEVDRLLDMHIQGELAAHGNGMQPGQEPGMEGGIPQTQTNEPMQQLANAGEV
jgi:hypothetical protein